jgi:hypothetical protein
MPNNNSKLRKALRKVAKPQTGWLDVFPAVIGKADGTVLTGTAGDIYVRNVLNGQTLTVHNAVAPNIATLQVEVGRRVEFPNLWQVKGVREAFSAPAGQGGLAYHVHQHVHPGPDSEPFPRKQIREFTVLIADSAAFIVQVYGGQPRTATGMALIDNQQRDLSSYVPATGALYLNIEADNDGVLTEHTGMGFGAQELATPADIPVPAAGKRRIATIILFESQEALLDEHILVPMPLEADLAGMETGTQINDAAADTPLDADKFGFWDVVDAALKSITWANIKATLKTYFDTLYSVLGHTHGAGYTDEEAQDAIGAMVDTTLEYVDATPLLRRAALTGVVTASAGSNDTTIAALSITNAMIANTTIDLAAKVTGILPAANGGTGVANGASSQLTLPNLSIQISGGVAAGNYVLPATAGGGTIPLLNTAQTFSATQTIAVSTTANTALILKTTNDNLTKNLLEFQNSGGGLLANVTPAGRISWVLSGSVVTATATFGEISTYNAGATKYGVVFSLFGNGASNAPAFTAMQGIVKSSSGAYSANLYTGFEANIAYQATSGTLNQAIGLMAVISKTAGATLIDAFGIRVNTFTSSGGGSITNAYGLYLDSQIAAGANYAIYTNLGLNRFGDQLAIVGAVDRSQLIVTGFTTQTLPAGYLIDNTAATNVIRNVLQLETQSTGTAAAGLGAGLLMSLETATASTNKNAGRLWSKWVVATNGSETSAVGLDAYTNSTAQEFISGEGNGGGVKLALYGGTRVARAAAMTAADAGAINSGDAGTDAVIANLRTRLGEVAAMLNATTGINVCA